MTPCARRLCLRGCLSPQVCIPFMLPVAPSCTHACFSPLARAPPPPAGQGKRTTGLTDDGARLKAAFTKAGPLPQRRTDANFTEFSLVLKYPLRWVLHTSGESARALVLHQADCFLSDQDFRGHAPCPALAADDREGENAMDHTGRCTLCASGLELVEERRQRGQRRNLRPLGALFASAPRASLPCSPACP